MITIRRSEDRGHANHGWLDTYFTFSFAEYRDPDFMHFSVLRVINQDVIEPGKGFGAHGHQDMEIVSYVLEGALEHKDSMGNGSQIRPGEVQVMSAGSGVTHSEFNPSPDERTHLLQMWVFPREKSTKPRYEQRSFPEAERRGRLRLVVSAGGEEGSLTIDQDARLFVGSLAAGEQTRHDLAPDRASWVHVARGRLKLNEHELGPGDGAAIRDQELVTLEGLDDAELVLWELPAEWTRA